MLLIRTAAVALLLLAFLKPVQEMFGSNQRLSGPRHVLILLDHSLSMEYQDGSLTGRARAVLEAEKVINTLGPEDLVNIRIVGRESSTCFPEFSADHADAVAFLKGLEPGLGRADFSKALAMAEQDFLPASGREELYLVSDFQRKSWGDVDLGKAPGTARLFFVNVAPDERQNHAILNAQFDRATANIGEEEPLQITLGNYARDSFSGELEVIVDGKRNFKTNAVVAPWSESKVTIPVLLGNAGVHTLEVRLPEDNLPQDDHYFLTASVAEKEEVLVVSDGTGGKQQSAGFFLTKALNPYENLGGALLPKSLNSDRLTPVEISTSKKMFLTGLEQLDLRAAGVLAKFLMDGGNIVYFCDGKRDAENLALIDKAAGSDVVPLVLSAKRSSANIESGAQQILHGDFRSKFLRLFRGSERPNLALLQFYEYYSATANRKGNVLLTYADGSPAMAVSHIGMGTLLVCNFSANELASNFARQRIFPAWIQDLVKVLDSEETPDKAAETGDEIHTEVWESDLKSGSVISPGGKMILTTRELDHGRYRVSFMAEQQGVYRLAEEQTPYAFAVNVPADESDLRSIDLDSLPRRLEREQTAQFVEGQHDFEALNTGKPLFQYFVLAALGMLLLEAAATALFRRLSAT